MDTNNPKLAWEAIATLLAFAIVVISASNPAHPIISTQPELFSRLSSGTFAGGYNGGTPSAPAAYTGDNIVPIGDRVILRSGTYSNSDFASGHHNKINTNTAQCTNAIMIFMFEMGAGVVCEGEWGSCVVHGEDAQGLFTVEGRAILDGDEVPNIFRGVVFRNGESLQGAAFDSTATSNFMKTSSTLVAGKYNPSGGAFQIRDASLQVREAEVRDSVGYPLTNVQRCRFCCCSLGRSSRRARSSKTRSLVRVTPAPTEVERYT